MPPGSASDGKQNYAGKPVPGGRPNTNTRPPSAGTACSRYPMRSEPRDSCVMSLPDLPWISDLLQRLARFDLRSHLALRPQIVPGTRIGLMRLLGSDAADMGEITKHDQNVWSYMPPDLNGFLRLVTQDGRTAEIHGENLSVSLVEDNMDGFYLTLRSAAGHLRLHLLAMAPISLTWVDVEADEETP